MQAHIRGTGLVLGLAVTVFGSPAAWADSADSADSVAQGATNEVVNKTVSVNEAASVDKTVSVNKTTSINEPMSIPAAPGDPDAQPPKGASETGDSGRHADGGQHLSVSLRALGMALGATAGAGAIVWREVRR